MNKFLLSIALASLPFAACAQGVQDAKAERARITTERGQAEADYRAAEKLCYGVFAVTDCLNEARSRRRGALADLRRQEIQLNDADRKRKAGERLRAAEEAAAAADRQQQAVQRARPAASSASAASAAGVEAARASKAAERQAQVTERQAQSAAERKRREAQAAANVKRHEQRMLEAKERKASLDKRLAEQKKPPSAPLPPAP